MNNNSLPIFIVGAPRSGTTLLTAILSNHPNIDAGPETQFFAKIPQKSLDLAVEDEVWPSIATKLISELSLSSQSVMTLFGLSEGELYESLKNKSPSVQAMLEVLTEKHCHKNGKIRWIEKTPNHILNIDFIRQLYPKSPIIRIVRDPRDSAVSMCKLPWASKSIFENAMLIEKWYQVSDNFFKHDSHSYTITYENIVKSPEQEVAELCQFIGEKYHPDLLNTKESGSRVSSKKEIWKTAVSGKIDVRRCYVWKRNMSHRVSWLLSQLCNNTINLFNYQLSDNKGYTISVNGLSSELNELMIGTQVLPLESINHNFPEEDLEGYIVIFKNDIGYLICLLFRTILSKLQNGNFYYINNPCIENFSLLNKLLIKVIKRFSFVYQKQS